VSGDHARASSGNYPNDRLASPVSTLGEVDVRSPTIRSIRRAAVVLVVAGGAGIVIFGAMAYLAAMWSFVMMDNPPPDPLWVPMWNVGRVGFVVGAALVGSGLALSLGVFVASVVRGRHLRR
jgi:hypothetical protein